MKILIAADGSPYTRVAARYVAHHIGSFAGPVEVHVLHVRPPIPYPIAASVVGKKAVDDYERDESLKALAVAEKELAKAGIPLRSSWYVGDVAAEIERYAVANRIDLIVTGSHGHGALANLALGSVVTRLLAAATVPVLVITREAASKADREQRKSRDETSKQRDAVASNG